MWNNFTELISPKCVSNGLSVCQTKPPQVSKGLFRLVRKYNIDIKVFADRVWNDNDCSMSRPESKTYNVWLMEIGFCWLAVLFGIIVNSQLKLFLDWTPPGLIYFANIFRCTIFKYARVAHLNLEDLEIDF